MDDTQVDEVFEQLVGQPKRSLVFVMIGYLAVLVLFVPAAIITIELVITAVLGLLAADLWLLDQLLARF